jgi:DNA-binding GntR family transcriptional regulator
MAGSSDARVPAAQDERGFARHARPIERRRVFEEIVERIEAMLLAGDLRPGDRLPPERELMRVFQVGRTSVREALFALQGKGVLALQAGERAPVTSPSAEGIEQSGLTRGRQRRQKPRNFQNLGHQHQHGHADQERRQHRQRGRFKTRLADRRGDERADSYWRRPGRTQPLLQR